MERERNISPLYQGSPVGQDRIQRLEKEIRTYEVLEGLNIEFQRIDHYVAETIEVCQEIDEILQTTICKNLFLCNSQKTEFYLLMIPGHKKFMTKILSKQIGSSRLSFAGPEYMEEFLDITPGSVSVLGLMNDKDKRVKLLIDKEVAESEHIGCHPCINTSSLRIKTVDLFEKFLKEIDHEATIVEL